MAFGLGDLIAAEITLILVRPVRKRRIPRRGNVDHLLNRWRL
jgi:hypothetical protein